MQNKILLIILTAAALTSCQSPTQAKNQIEEHSAVKPFETIRTQKEEFDKDWNQQFATPLRDNAIHKMVTNAIRKANGGDKKVMPELCLKPNMQCYLQRISFPNEKVKNSGDYTKVIHRELYQVNDQELAIFGYEKAR